MGQVVKIKPEHARKLRLDALRREAEDFHHMLRTQLEHETGKPVRTLVPPLPIEKIAFPLGVQIAIVEDLSRIDSPQAEIEMQICGALDRTTRTIFIERRLPPDQQRYTIGHEYAHLFLHSDPVHHRQRVAKRQNSLTLGQRTIPDVPEQEIEAQRFSAELLMPLSVTEEEMLARFGARIDTTLPHDTLAYHLSIATRQRLSATELSSMPQIDRAMLIARADSFGGQIFEPLNRRFGVSVEAMARRLLELGLVT